MDLSPYVRLVRTPVADFKDLKVWQVAMALAAESYSLTARLPPAERFGLISQIRRAAVSVPSNIAEGYGRRALGDYSRFLRIANGSLKELETQILLTCRLQMLSEGEAVAALDSCQQVGRMLTTMIRNLNR